jgi:glycosyltransferase involved in cell wall biosynthesis
MKEKIIILKNIKNPKISVIIPTFNEEKYVESTLLSLKSQTIKVPYEIIVVDSNSKDRTVKIARKYANKVIVTKRRGIAVGRNVGAKYSKGEILVFVDADTVLLPNVLEKAYNEIKKRDVSLVSCPIVPLSCSPILHLMYRIYNQFSISSIKFGRPQISGMLMVTKKSIFNAVGGFNENLKILEDFDFSEKVSKFGKVKMITNTFVLTSPRRIEKWGKIKSVINYILWIYSPYLFAKKDTGWKIYMTIR